MTSDQIYKIVGGILVMIAGVLGTLAAIHVLITLPIPEGKGPEWIGAIGTVLTLAGTIWLATSESRRRNREETTRAQLQAASLHLRFARAHSAVELVRKNLKQFVTAVPSHDLTRLLSERLDSIELWTVEDLVPLARLPNRAAICLAQAADQIIYLRDIFSTVLAANGLASPDGRKKFIDAANAALVKVMHDLEIGIDECKVAVKASIDSLPTAAT